MVARRPDGPQPTMEEEMAAEQPPRQQSKPHLTNGWAGPTALLCLFVLFVCCVVFFYIVPLRFMAVVACTCGCCRLGS